MLQVGDKAPDFTLPNQDGEPMSLAELKGSGPLVLFFYPKADTPGCTIQACGVRDHRRDYVGAGATVLGISPDPVEAVKAFHDGQGLNFALLADEDHTVCEAYDVWGEKQLYGKTYLGAFRTTFILDEQGTIRHIISKVSPQTHDDEVLAALAELDHAAA
jgi:thioredoxin-dependent peroxiredoxin